MGVQTETETARKKQFLLSQSPLTREKRAKDTHGGPGISKGSQEKGRVCAVSRREDGVPDQGRGRFFFEEKKGQLTSTNVAEKPGRMRAGNWPWDLVT